MKILVTGGTGLTGKARVEQLPDEGHQGAALDDQEGLETDEPRRWGAEVVIGGVVGQCMQGGVQSMVGVFCARDDGCREGRTHGGLGVVASPRCEGPMGCPLSRPVSQGRIRF